MIVCCSLYIVTRCLLQNIFVWTA